VTIKSFVTDKIKYLALNHTLTVLEQYRNKPVRDRTSLYLNLFNTDYTVNLHRINDELLDLFINLVKKRLKTYRKKT